MLNRHWRLWEHLAHAWCGLVGGTTAIVWIWVYWQRSGQVEAAQVHVAVAASLLASVVFQVLFALLAGWMPTHRAAPDRH